MKAIIQERERELAQLGSWLSSQPIKSLKRARLRQSERAPVLSSSTLHKSLSFAGDIKPAVCLNSSSSSLRRIRSVSLYIYTIVYSFSLWPGSHCAALYTRRDR